MCVCVCACMYICNIYAGHIFNVYTIKFIHGLYGIYTYIM